MWELTDIQLRQVIVSCKIKVKCDKMDTMRELAKRPEIRHIWITAKTQRQPLFEGMVYNWNMLQKRLSFWLNYYSSVEGAYNKPPDWVIRNNELVDKWMKEQVKESERESEQNWRKGKVDVPRTPYDHDEVYETSSL